MLSYQRCAARRATDPLTSTLAWRSSTHAARAAAPVPTCVGGLVAQDGRAADKRCAAERLRRADARRERDAACPHDAHVDVRVVIRDAVEVALLLLRLLRGGGSAG
jgi:hypothetical protein